MSAAWVAGTVRARAMARRGIGTAAAREVAASPSLASAKAALADGPYGRDLREATGLAGCQRAVADSLLWNMRVLAGWLPAQGVTALRALAGWFEIANVDEHLSALAGAPADPPFRLGMLATAWPRLALTGSAAQLRTALAGGWRDPGGEAVHDIQLSMRLAWADRVRLRVRPAASWVLAAAALLVARERFALGRRLSPESEAAATRVLGRAAVAGDSLTTFTDVLPPAAAGALAGVREPGDLWLAEVRWWGQLRTGGRDLLAGAGFGLPAAVGAVAVLAGDAWLVRAALAAAARGGDVEAFDALA